MELAQARPNFPRPTLSNSKVLQRIAADFMFGITVGRSCPFAGHHPLIQCELTD